MANPLLCDNVTPACPVEASIYGYYPNTFANYFFAAFFGLFTFLNMYLGWRYRTWTYMIGMGLGCLSSCIGYAGRIMLHTNPFNSTAFKLQITLLIIAPAYLSAAIYLTLKHICLCFGERWSRIRPRFYTWIFIIADSVSLALQGAGGGIAASAGQNAKLRAKGDHLAMAGIVWQVFTLSAFGVLVIDFIVRRKRALKLHPYSEEAKATVNNSKFRLFAVGLATAFLGIFLRCVYRIPEMAGGWRNPIMQNETLFIICEGATISIAVLVMTLFHPGFCFPRLAGGVAKGMYSPVRPSNDQSLPMSHETHKGSNTDTESASRRSI